MAFATWRAVSRGTVARKHAQIGQIGIGQAIPDAEILFPHPGIMGEGQAGKQCCGSLATPQRRAGKDMRDIARCARHPRHCLPVKVLQRHISAPAQPPVRCSGRMPEQNQFCRGQLHQEAFHHSADLLFHVTINKSILISGDTRSGESEQAERLTVGLAPSAIRIATAQAFDAEIAHRIARHQDRLGAEWRTFAEPRDQPGALRDSDGGPPRLVNCLTLWLSNLMLAEMG